MLALFRAGSLVAFFLLANLTFWRTRLWPLWVAQAVAVIALAAWEPRIALDAINVTYSASGAVTAELSGMLTETMEKSTRAVTLRSATDADN